MGISNAAQMHSTIAKQILDVLAEMKEQQFLLKDLAEVSLVQPNLPL
jgi:hypothetical protein